MPGCSRTSNNAPCSGRLTIRSQVRATNWGVFFNVRSQPDGANADLAYSAEALGLHVDNPYRCDWQLAV